MNIDLNQLHADLSAEVGSGTLLELKPANAEQAQLVDFLKTVPDTQFAIDPVALTLNTAGDELVVAGTLSQTWDVRGWSTDGIALSAIHLRYFQDGSETKIELSLVGTVGIGARVVPLTGTWQPDQHVRFLSDPSQNSAISLVNMANFISNNRLGAYLPEGYDTFDEVPLTRLDLLVGFSRTALNKKGFNSTITTDWKLVPDKVEIKSVGLSLDSRAEYNKAGNFVESFGGEVQGTFVLGTEFDIRVRLTSNHEWLIRFIPKDGNVLPGLANLAGLVGGESLQTAISDATSHLGLRSISLDGVSVGVNKDEKKVKRAEIYGHVDFYDLRFKTRMYLPNFEFLGELDPSTPIHLKGFLTKFFSGASAFPEIDLTSLRLFLQPRQDIYTLHAEIQTDWSWNIGSSTLGVKAFLFDLKKKRDEVSGSIEGVFDFLGTEYDLYAEHPSTEEGWNITGQKTGRDPIAIGTFIGDLATHFGVSNHLPPALTGLQLDDLSFQVNTQTKDFTFFCSTQMPIDDKELSATLRISVNHNQGTYQRNISGSVTVGDLRFDLIFDQEAGQDSIYLASFQNQSGKDENLKAIAELITSNSDVLSAAESMTFQLKDALLVVDKGTSTRLLFGLDIKGGIDLSRLPLLGKFFPAESSLRMTMQPVITNQDFSQTDLNRVRPLVPSGGYQLPTEAKERLALNLQLQVAGQSIAMDLPIVADDVKTQPASGTEGGSAPDPASPAVAPSTSNVKWFKVGKELGPVHLGRVGVAYEGGQLKFLVDASVSVGGLKISMDGLSVESGLHPIHPKFGLHGLGIDYQKGPLEIGGAFLRETLTDAQGNHYDTYDGGAIIRTEEFALSALGSYAFYQGHPSLFVYAFVDAPLGGPAFFFVTGAAAGFGFNRRLIIPGIQQVRSFPLVEEAVAGTPGTTSDLNSEVAKLHSYIPPSVGDHFFAIGLRFTSFKILDSFALLSVSLGNEFEVDVLGLSTLVLPVPEAGQSHEALAEVQMALRAAFNPGKGYLKVRAALTPASYVLSRDCHLTGGFAFYSWFKDNPQDGAPEGDFVLTLGGYHPRFQKPAHYPTVAPLGFNWRVSSHIDIKGNLYFALTPSAAMAGGHLSATWHSGHIKAWFDVGADFIISWKPYFYDASFHVSVGVSYTYHFFGTHHISAHVGADLHVWGPKFSGKAHVHLWIVTFNITFGAHSKQSPSPISWDAFRTGFLPANDAWNSLKVTKGLVKKSGTEADPIFVVNPKEFHFETNATIPVTQSSQSLGDSNTQIHIGSMGITDAIQSDHEVTIRLDGVDVTDEFTFEPVKKRVPGALWGNKLRHGVNEGQSDRLIDNACTGFNVKGKGAASSDQTHEVSSHKLLNQDEYFGRYLSYDSAPTAISPWLKTTGTRALVSDGLERRAPARRSILDKMGFQSEALPHRELADRFIVSTL